MACRTRYGVFETLVMPFRLTHAPVSFQEFINDTLQPCLDIFFTAFLDDRLIFSDNLMEHKEHVRAIMTTQKEAGLYLKVQKWIPSARSQVPRTDSCSEWHQNGPRKGDGGQRMGSSRETQAGSSIFEIHKFLPKVHEELQQGGPVIDETNVKACTFPLGTRSKTSVRRIAGCVYNGTCPAKLQLWKGNWLWDGCIQLRICMSVNTIR
jgi:hypothetical protein